MTGEDNTTIDCSEYKGLHTSISYDTVILKVPKYQYEFKIDNLPYYQPKELYDIDGNMVDYDLANGEFMAYKTKYDDNGKPCFAYENGGIVPLRKLNEADIKPFLEDGLVQITNYNCGPAAALQTLDLLEYNNHTIIPVPVKTKKLWYGEECCVDGDYENTHKSNQRHFNNLKPNLYSHSAYVQCYREFTDRQVSLMEEAGTTCAGTPEAKSVAVAINTYFKEKTYTHLDINENSEGDLKILSDKIYNNLINGFPVVFMVNVMSLLHYNNDPNKIARHYVTATGYKITENLENDVVTVVDPNYSFRNRGIYTVTLKELIHSMTQAREGENGNFVFVDNM